MPIHILYLTISATLPWQCTLKERRQQAQKLRDLIKNKYNASVKLDYAENNQQFKLYFVTLGENTDYLQDQIENLYQLMDENASVQYSFDHNIEAW